MSTFKVSMNGRPEDLLRQIGMSLNSFIRKVVGEHGTKPIATTFLRPQDADAGWIRDHVVLQVARALQARPNEARGFDTIIAWVRESYKDEIKGWIEDNRERLAELGFIRDDFNEIRVVPKK